MLLISIALGAALAGTPGHPTADGQRSFRFEYRAAVPEVPAGAKQVRMWIPVPLDSPDQAIGNMTLEVNGHEVQSGTLSSGKAAGGPSWTVADISGGLGRSLCVESSGQPVEVVLSFDVQRHESKGGGAATEEELAHLREPNSLIPLGGKVSAMAASMKLPDEPSKAARMLYDHTLERMKYDKPDDGGGWGRGDAEWACDARYGNCTDFHSYFMGLARTRGMAARFEMGFPIPGGDEKVAKVGGYHCWAYVWIDGHGWWPVDISEADKHPEQTDYYFGTLDAGRVMMTGGRDLQLTPAPAAGRVNFFVYPYVEIDGQPSKAFTKAFQRTNL
jgi:hypothetical protein